MRIVTLTTDYGLENYAVAAVKGALFSAVNNLQIVDITHFNKLYDVRDAAFNVNSAYKHFPEGSIHIIAVDEEISTGKELLLAHINGHYFISANNGVFCLLFEEELKEVYEIPTPEPTTFPTLTYIPNIVKQLIEGVSLEEIGEKKSFKPKYLKSNAHYDEKNNKIRGEFIHIDRHGNLVTNFHRDFISNIIGNHPFRILFNGVSEHFSGIHDILPQYNQVGKIHKLGTNPKEKHDGSLIPVFNHQGLLEIAMYRSVPETYGSLPAMYGLKAYHTLFIEVIK